MGKGKILVLPTSIARKQSGQLKKLFGLWGNKRKDIELNPRSAVMRDGIPNFLNQTRGVRGTFVTRRQIVLNRHYTEIVSDVLAQSFKEKLDEFGISVTSIESRAWNKGVCIYYTAPDGYSEQLHLRLNKLLPNILAAITERRLIGRTPMVGFVYDKTVDLDKHLSDALSNINLDSPKETQLATSGATQLYVSKDLGTLEQKLISKRFVAPADMDNTMFGLDYPTLYDEVALKLSRGRGEVSRMQNNFNIMTDAKPLFRGPKIDQSEEDPFQRLMRMKKFIISQKQKSENIARSRRKAEIYARNSVKWLKIDEGGHLSDKDVTL